MQPEEYYKLYEDESKKDLYYKSLKKLSNQTTSRDLFQNQVDKKWHERRQQLHDKILKKFIDEFRSKIQPKPTIAFILGSIGSGKTSAKDKIMKNKGKSYLYINFDDIKKELPEYEILKKINPKKAAEFVQSESAVISSRLLKKAIKEKINIIYEKNLTLTKDKELHIIEEIKKASKRGYLVSVYVVFLDTIKEALKRVKKRTIEIKRHVPSEKVKDTFNDLFPLLNRIIEDQELKIETVHFLYNGNKEVRNEIGEDDKKSINIGFVCFNLTSKNYNKLLNYEELSIYGNRDNRVLGIFFKNSLKRLPKLATNQLKELDFFKNG